MGEVPYQELEKVMNVLFPEDPDEKKFEATPEFEAVFGKVPEISDQAVSVSNVDGLFENLMVPENENCKMCIRDRYSSISMAVWQVRAEKYCHSALRVV